MMFYFKYLKIYCAVPELLEGNHHEKAFLKLIISITSYNNMYTKLLFLNSDVL